MPITVDELNKSTTVCFTTLAIKEGLTPRKIIKEIKELAFSDLKHHITVDAGGAIIAKPLDQIGSKSKAVKKIREKSVIAENKDGSVLYKTSTIEYELHDKISALDQAMGLHGMKKPKQLKHEIDGNITIEIVKFGTGADTDQADKVEPEPTSAAKTGKKRGK